MQKKEQIQKFFPAGSGTGGCRGLENSVVLQKNE